MSHETTQAKVPLEDTVRLVLCDKTEVECSLETLRNKSAYFQALFRSGTFTESLSRRITLLHLDSKAVQAVMSYLHSGKEDFECDFHWDEFDQENQEDISKLEEAMDYLQITSDDALQKYSNTTSRGWTKSNSVEVAIRALQFLKNPHIVRKRCVEIGWVRESGEVKDLPIGKRMRAWRFWICFILVLSIFPEDNVKIVSCEFMKSIGTGIEGSGGAGHLCRDLMAFGLIQRETDGSAYWRPVFTVSLVNQWIRGILRKVAV